VLTAVAANERPATGARPTEPKKARLEQTFLDFGQRDIGPISCAQCGMMYSRGVAEDEALHAAHHKSKVGGVDFHGWQCEEVVWRGGEEGGDRIIAVGPKFGAAGHRTKVLEVLEAAGKDVGGFAGTIDPSDERLKVFLYIAGAEKKVAGVSVGENDVPAQRLDPSQPAVVIALEDKKETAVAGIKLIWSHWGYRRRGVATALLEAVRRNICYGYTVPKGKCAFSTPTTSGRALATRYLGIKDVLFY